MKPRLFVPLFVAGLLLVFGTIAAACGGNGESSLEKYFQRLEATFQDIDERFAALESEFPGAFEEPGPTRDALSAIVLIIGDSRDALAQIDPPDEAQQAHKEFLDSAAAFQELMEDIAGQLADAETASDLEAVLGPSWPQFEAASARSGAACVALEGIGADNGIEVDLGCGSE